MIDIMVIGDSLSASDVHNNTRMTGPAAQILKDTMQKVGLPFTSDKVYYTVALKEMVSKKKGQVVKKETMEKHRASLLQEIRTVQPKFILPLGKTAFQTLTGEYNAKITEEYSRSRKYSFCGEAEVIPIMHPAVIMRAPADYKPFIQSLQFVNRLYQGNKAYDPGKPNWIVLNTEQKCDGALKFLLDYTRVTADIETTGLDYRTAEFCVLGICFEKNKVFIVPREFRHRVVDFFALENLKWSWQGGKYDRKVLWRRRLTQFDKWGWHKFPHHNDTIYMHYMLDETSAHDLGYLTKTYLNAEEYKYKMNQNFKAVTLDTYASFFEALCERVAVDCDYGFQLENKLQEILDLPENSSLLKCYNNLLMPATGFLARVEQNGMLIDQKFLREMDLKYESLLTKLLHEVEVIASPYWDAELYMAQTGAKSAPSSFNPASPKQMSWMVFDKLKLKPRRKKGRSTDADVLESIAEDIPLINKVLEYRGVAKEKSTYVVGMLKRCDTDGRVRSNFSLHITATGRLSSKEPNVQNMPSANGVGNIRQAFIPPPGKIIMEVDYSGAELRWLGFLSGCPVLGEVFKSGRNLHKETAKALYGESFTLQQKMRAKAANFGIAYGREAASFKDELNITMEEAEHMVQGWLDKYHGARDYLQWCADQVLKGNYLQTPWGNRRRAGLVTAESLHGLQNEFKNFNIQGSSSHTLLYACIQMEPVLKERWDVDICDLIHDSVYLEVPMDPKTVREVSQYCEEYMKQVPKMLFDCPIPFECDTDLGADWGHLATYNNKTGMMEIEDEHHEVTEVPYATWITTQYHWDTYKEPWFLELEGHL